MQNYRGTRKESRRGNTFYPHRSMFGLRRCSRNWWIIFSIFFTATPNLFANVSLSADLGFPPALFISCALSRSQFAPGYHCACIDLPRWDTLYFGKTWYTLTNSPRLRDNVHNLWIICSEQTEYGDSLISSIIAARSQDSNEPSIIRTQLLLSQSSTMYKLMV